MDTRLTAVRAAMGLAAVLAGAGSGSASAQGDAVAQFTLGTMYDTGQGVPQDYAEAVRWTRLAADQGVAWAQAYLGNMYETGEGVPPSYVQAHMWHNLVASR